MKVLINSFFDASKNSIKIISYKARAKSIQYTN